MEQFVHGVIRFRPASFGKRKRQQAKQSGAARKGLTDSIRKLEMFAAGQHAEAILSPLIRPCLEVRQEAGRPLNFVQDRARADSGEQTTWIALGELPFIGRFKVDVGQVGKRLAAECGLARLAWSRDGHEGIALKQTLEDGSDVARNHGGNPTTRL